MLPPGGGAVRVFPTRPRSGWTPVGNKAAAQNFYLSLKAKGLLLTLLSFRDDNDITLEKIVELHEKAGGKGEGRYAVREAMKELREAGLVVHIKAKGKDGKWRMTTGVSDNPERLLLLLSEGAPGADFQGA